MPLALHDALVRSTPVSPGPPPAPVAVASTCVLGLSPWKPVAILVTYASSVDSWDGVASDWDTFSAVSWDNLVSGGTRILRVETPSPAEKGKTFRQAWIGEVYHLAEGSQDIFPDLESAKAVAIEILAKLWLEDNTPAPPSNRPTRWSEFLTELWNTPAMGTWSVPVPGTRWNGTFPGARWNTYGKALNWENY
jgi:hypothetical protein